MKTIKSLNQLYKCAGAHQVTAQEVLNERTYINGAWQSIKVAPELQSEIIETIINTAGGWQKTKANMRRTLDERPQHWALARFLLEKYKGPAFFSYCAGQDMTSEMRHLRTYLNK